jgi:hypothetical protein
MPRAGHCTHQCPGEVIKLMRKRKARMSGPFTRKPSACSVLMAV